MQSRERKTRRVLLKKTTFAGEGDGDGDVARTGSQEHRGPPLPGQTGHVIHPERTVGSAHERDRVGWDVIPSA